jgi:DNA polymerase
MSLTREDMLRELELLPAWKLNQALMVNSIPQASQAVAEISKMESVEAFPEVVAVSTNVADMDWGTLNQHIAGSGDQHADWLFVGDVAMTGDAATLLDKMLIATGLERGKNVYLTPLSEPEYFKRQIVLIQPKLIFVFGEQAAQALLNSQAPLDALRGKVHQHENVALIASYAPSHLLNHTQDKAKAWADLCLARDILQAMK